jgi:hypothetical protein
MQAIRRFFASRRTKGNDMYSKLKTGPQAVVSPEVLEMRLKADEMLEQAREVYVDALTISERLEAMRSGDDFIADALLAHKGEK